jgi:acetyltransferase-like isoleucine patch superfamily enzyme
MDPERLRRLAGDPEVVAAGLATWAVGRDVDGSPEALMALQRTALAVRELDGGRALGRLADTLPPLARHQRVGLRGGVRTAVRRRMVTRLHAVHAARLLWSRGRAALGGQDVQLAGMSFLGRRVELTAPAGHGRLTVGPWCWLGDGVALRAHGGRVTLGPKVVIGTGTVVNAYLDITIGEGALLADGVHVTDFDHRVDRLDLPVKDQGIVSAPVRIGPDVWIGRGVTVLRGVDIGRGAVVGAGAVVTRDVPPFAVAVGVPAEVVRSRLPDGVDPYTAAARADAGLPVRPD